MKIKVLKAALLTVSAVLLAGCNIDSVHQARALQMTGEQSQTACERQAAASATTVAQLREELRLANERAQLAEERAELEKRKWEFAEERLKLLEGTDETEKATASTAEAQTSGS